MPAHVGAEDLVVELPLLFWIGLAVVTGIAAQSRGRYGFGWFLLALMISGILALILVLVLPNLRLERQIVNASRSSAADSKSCPRCAETIKRAAKVCRFCGYEFSEAELAPPAAVIRSIPDPRVGDHSEGRPVTRRTFKGIGYLVHSDAKVVTHIDRMPYTWESAAHFEAWAEANPEAFKV